MGLEQLLEFIAGGELAQRRFERPIHLGEEPSLQEGLDQIQLLQSPAYLLTVAEPRRHLGPLAVEQQIRTPVPTVGGDRILELPLGPRDGLAGDRAAIPVRRQRHAEP
jgi:hypothetical protein